MRVYFFEVLIEEPGRSFPDLFQEAADNQGYDRVARVNKYGTEVRLERPHRATKDVAGDLVRIRMTGIPAKIRRSGGTSEIDLLHDQGIGEETAFYYDRSLDVLAIESNRNGVTPSSLARYFSLTNSQHTQMTLSPVLDLSRIQDLQQLKTVTSIAVSVTTDTDLLNLSPPATVGSMIDTAREVDAPSIEVRMTVGHEWRQKTLKPSRIVELARFLLRKAPENVTQLKISGENEDEEHRNLDMLNGRLHYDSPPNNSQRRAGFEARRTILREAIEAHRAKLSEG
jgi:hypothetical protein